MNTTQVEWVVLVWFGISAIIAALYFKKPSHVFFASAISAAIGIGVSAYFIGAFLDGGGIIHIICVGLISVALFYLFKAIRKPNGRT
jgi:hypothetical protein